MPPIQAVDKPRRGDNFIARGVNPGILWVLPCQAPEGRKYLNSLIVTSLRGLIYIPLGPGAIASGYRMAPCRGANAVHDIYGIRTLSSVLIGPCPMPHMMMSYQRTHCTSSTKNRQPKLSAQCDLEWLVDDQEPKIPNSTPAATAEPTTPATFGAMACISR